MTAEKFILDATAGYRMMWFNKKHPNAIYLDQRPECEPDVVGDFRDLRQFADETFRLIVFDPPYFTKPNGSSSSFIDQRFGYLQPETWQSDLQKAFAELWRVLHPQGVLLIKWQTAQFASSDILKLFPEKPLLYQITRNKPRRWKDKSGKQSARKVDQVYTLWFCFMKIPEEASP